MFELNEMYNNGKKWIKIVNSAKWMWQILEFKLCNVSKNNSYTCTEGWEGERWKLITVYSFEKE